MSTSHLGGWLKHAREARGLTIQALAAQTKIPARHLDALERGAPVKLPVFYQRAEVRAVARAVGLDEQEAVARLEALLGPAEPAPAPVPQRSQPVRIRSEYVLLAGVVVMVAWMLGWGPFARAAASEAAVASTVPAAAAPAAAPAAVEPAIAPIAVVTPKGPTELVVRTQPEGARVTVNGIGWGVTPVTIRHVEPGEKRIRVSMDGYASIERAVAVNEGSRESVNVQLREFRAP